MIYFNYEILWTNFNIGDYGDMSNCWLYCDDTGVGGKIRYRECLLNLNITTHFSRNPTSDMKVIFLWIVEYTPTRPNELGNTYESKLLGPVESTPGLMN